MLSVVYSLLKLELQMLVDVCGSRMKFCMHKMLLHCIHVGPRGSAVERQSLASVLSPSCARPVADG